MRACAVFACRIGSQLILLCERVVFCERMCGKCQCSCACVSV